MKKQGKSYYEIRKILNIKYDRLEKMLDYVETNGCRRKTILDYFGDPAAAQFSKSCNGCDICLDYQWQKGLSDKLDFEFGMEKNVPKKTSARFSDTVLESIKLYKKGRSVKQIAKIRNLGQSTIIGHLIKWCLRGGDLRIEELVSQEEENQILSAINILQDSKNPQFYYLSDLKKHLPDQIGYEKIKLVCAKIGRMATR